MHITQLSHRCLFFLATAMAIALVPARVKGQESPGQEADLIALLRSDAPAADKAIACKKLAIFGSENAVPELAKLLSDPQLSSWARISLEAIPGDAADDALHKASETLTGRLLVGTINSIGVRRNARAVASLADRLTDSDVEVASAAAVALGQIGNEPARTALQQALASSPAGVRSAVAEGFVLCAERLHAEGNSDAAVDIYDQIRTADVPKQRVVEATRGAILARGEGGVPLLMETFRSPDKQLFQLALGTIREFPGTKVDQALADELASSTPPRAALLIQAMADRNETVVLEAVVRAAEHGDKQVRLSAINALQRVGDVSCLSTLLQIVDDPDQDLSQAAYQTLAVIPGDSVDAKMVALLPDAKDETYRFLIQLIGERRIDAIPDLLKALNHPESVVRRAALVSLGETVPLDRLSLLISQVVDPKYPEDVPVAIEALKAASVRMPDREACATELAGALRRASTSTTSALLEIMSEVGGPKALATLASAAKSDNPELQDTSSRLLGVWNGVDAAPVLLDLANNAPADKFKVRALRGYIGLARKFAMPESQRASMCEQAMATALRADEQKLVLDVLKLHPSVDGLKVAIAAKRVPQIKGDAEAAAMEIAQKLRNKGIDVSELMRN
jgi:HEAT repeat protein